MPTLRFELEVSDAEKASLLARMTGTVAGALTVIGDGASTDDDTGPVNTSAPTLDSRNIPWNPDFHASTKGLNADGTWKAKRNHNKDALAAWEKTVTVIPASIANTTAPVVLQGAAPVVALPGMGSGLPGFPPPQAAPADIPVTMDDINAIFAKLGSLNLLAADGSNLTPVYAEAKVVSGDQLATDETCRKRLRDELRKAFPQAGI